MKFKTKKKKTDIPNTFTYNLQPWNGIVISQDPYTIAEDTAVWLNGLPKLTGAFETVKDKSLVYTHSTAVNYFFTFNLGGNQYFAILDGSNLSFYSSNFTLITSFATTETICDYCVQDNSYLWVITRNFLITFNGTNIYNLTTYGITGDTICYWKGRIFVGKDRTLTFSVPSPDATGATKPFNTAQGAGSIGLTVSVFSKIYALIPKEDSIYLFTDMSIIAMIGTTISNDPTQWYITEIVKDLGITGIRKYTVYGHEVYFHSIYGIYKIIATTPEKIDDAITNITNTIYAIDFFDYNNITYIAVSCNSFIDSNKKAIYCYNTLTNRWYALDIECNNITHHLNSYYISSGDKIYKLFSSDNYLPLKVKTKVFFNVNNTYMNIKNVILYGRGNYNFVSQLISLVYGSQQDNIIFITVSQQLLSITQSQDFWLVVFKPTSTTPFQQRLKQFQLYLQQSNTDYCELINITINGTVGARYV